MKRKTNNTNKIYRILGFAFLLQAITSVVSGAILLSPLLKFSTITEVMTKVANNPWQMRLAILGDTLTAMGIIFLGVLMYLVLRPYTIKWSLTALGLYILEACILAISRVGGIALLFVSEKYLENSGSETLLILGELCLYILNFGYTLHAVPFCIGAMIFYFLFCKHQVLPCWLARWGFLSLVPCLYAVLMTLMGKEVSFLYYLPYAPFEFFIGVWILLHGIHNSEEKST
jgi:hypothetical protein